MSKIEAVLQTGAVHFMGNGRLGTAACGLELLEVFGPPYSNAPLFSLKSPDGKLTHSQVRIPGTAIWEHELEYAGEDMGSMCEFVDEKLPCYIRHVRLKNEISFQIEIRETAEQIENGDGYGIERSRGLLLQHDAGIYVYGKYPSPVPLNYQLLVTGCMELCKIDEFHYNLIGHPGEGMFCAVGGKDLREVVISTEEFLVTPYESMKKRTKEYWESYQKEGYDPEKLIPPGTPQREKMLQIFDSVSVLMKAQQGESGGVICGSVFHWAALRDQYGVSRSFLEQGHIKEARAILEYYWRIWQKRGVLHNGQDIGLDGFFHIHENDEVEITGYLVIQAFDYLVASHEKEFLKEIMPMLLWAYEVQKKNLWHNMLPFNGDETYIAGGVLPRNVLNDGSAEATLLFWTGGIRLLAFLEEEKMAEDKWIAENRTLLDQVEQQYRDNFVRDELLITNNPERKQGMILPRFRHGVCEACWDPPYYTFGWTEKNGNDRYVCPSCKVSRKLERAPEVIHRVQSVSLQPLFLRSSLFTKEEVAYMVEDIVQMYQETGRLPSRPDGNVTVGYDYGLLLYNLVELQHPLAGEIYEKMLSVIDECGAWAEYYENGRPSHTRCRPWESGINLLAAICFSSGEKAVF